jgi:16S rRNA (guanine966-N2)-methyltransferase
MLCRPTASVVRGAFLDIAGRTRIDSRSILDLCAGTGAVGLEALSWGASHCCFIDSNPASTAFIRNFLREHDSTGEARVITGDVRKYIGRVRKRPDVVFIDPPYSSTGLYRWIDEFNWADYVNPGGAIFIESGCEIELKEGWQMRRYGDSYLIYLLLEVSE